MTTTDLVLTCTGRAVDDRLQPVGDPCGAVYPRPAANEVWMQTRPAGRAPLADDTRYVQAARAAGWNVADVDGTRHATCPDCRRGS